MARVKSKYEAGRLRFYGGAVDFSLTSESSASVTLKNFGLSVIDTTHVRTLAAPTSGAFKQLLFYGTTKTMTVKTTRALFNKQDKQDVFKVDLSTASAKEVGYPVFLVGSGTTNWWLLANNINNTTGFTAQITLTSDT